MFENSIYFFSLMGGAHLVLQYNYMALLLLVLILVVAFAICYFISWKNNLYGNHKSKNTFYQYKKSSRKRTWIARD